MNTNSAHMGFIQRLRAWCARPFIDGARLAAYRDGLADAAKRYFVAQPPRVPEQQHAATVLGARQRAYIREHGYAMPAPPPIKTRLTPYERKNVLSKMGNAPTKPAVGNPLSPDPVMADLFAPSETSPEDSWLNAPGADVWADISDLASHSGLLPDLDPPTVEVPIVMRQKVQAQAEARRARYNLPPLEQPESERGACD